MIVSLKGSGIDLSTTGHPPSWYEGVKQAGKAWVAIDLMTAGFEADVANALEADLDVILFQGYYVESWSNPAEAVSRAKFALQAAKASGYEGGAPIALDFESVNVDAEAAASWATSWANTIADGGYVPAIYVGVPQPLDADALYALPFQHYWKAGSADAVEVSSRGYQLVQGELDATLDGVTVDLDEAGTDALGDSMMAMAKDPVEAIARVSSRTVWTVGEGQTLSGIAAAVRVPMSVLARYNHITDLNLITAGEEFAIPTEYRVKSGDTLSAICDRLHEPGITWQFIADVNRINPDLLWPGQQIWV